MRISMVSIPVDDPVKAHEIYTTKLGFVSKDFDPKAQISCVASPEEPEGTVILLEPCIGTFAEKYKIEAYKSNLPIMVFSSKDPKTEIERLEKIGIKIRRDIEKPEYGLVNLFEDGCGNILMIQQ